MTLSAFLTYPWYGQTHKTRKELGMAMSDTDAEEIGTTQSS